MGPFKASRKIFVVITGRDESSPGIYSSWKLAQSHIQGIKKTSGITVEWDSFEGAQRDTESLLYWHSHYKEPPQYYQSPTAQAATTPQRTLPPPPAQTRQHSKGAPTQAQTQTNTSRESNTPIPSKQRSSQKVPSSPWQQVEIPESPPPTEESQKH